MPFGTITTKLPTKDRTASVQIVVCFSYDVDGEGFAELRRIEEAELVINGALSLDLDIDAQEQGIIDYWIEECDEKLTKILKGEV